jgi:hypothetical protein
MRPFLIPALAEGKLKALRPQRVGRGLALEGQPTGDLESRRADSNATHKNAACPSSQLTRRVYLHAMPSMPIELPPKVAQSFIRDLRFLCHAEHPQAGRDCRRPAPGAQRAPPAAGQEATACRREADVFANEGPSMNGALPATAG